MIRTLAAAALIAGLAAPALAQDVSDCDLRSSARNLAEPWEDSTRTFAQGAIRLAVIDMIEPAGAPFYLLVLSPPYDEIGDRQCRMIGGSTGMGLYSIDLAGATAAYEAARGLVVSVPTRVYGDASGQPTASRLTVTINQATGEISATAD